jgi:hypothetical protein
MVFRSLQLVLKIGAKEICTNTEMQYSGVETAHSIRQHYCTNPGGSLKKGIRRIGKRKL